jgi:hypothetical protein
MMSLNNCAGVRGAASDRLFFGLDGSLLSSGVAAGVSEMRFAERAERADVVELCD